MNTKSSRKGFVENIPTLLSMQTFGVPHWHHKTAICLYGFHKFRSTCRIQFMSQPRVLLTLKQAYARGKKYFGFQYIYGKAI